MTLIELTIALGLSSLVAMAAIKMWNYFEQSARANETEKDAKSDLESLVHIIQKTWKVRQHPIDPVTRRPIEFTAAQKGFSLKTLAGAACISNCPRIKIDVERTLPSGPVVDVIEVITKCIDPGMIAAKNRLNTLTFNDPVSCANCAPGTIPIVTYTSQNKPTDNKQYPSNTLNLPNSFRINSVLGMTACWEQSADGPALLSIGTYTLRHQTTNSGLKFNINKKMLPFDNFSKMILKSSD